jgi:penicillin-binding protein 1C
MLKKTHRPLKKILTITLSGLFIFFLLVFLYISYLLPIPEALFIDNNSISTKIFDRNGKLLYEAVNHDFGRKSYFALKDMPEQFIQAILASEDSNFYQHIGVDPGAIFRAFFYNSLERKITSGASTITQQLVRNMFGTNRERNFQEKIIEAIYSVRISNAYSKDQILEKYLNTVYFGNLSYGAGEAARNYFGKNLQELDLAELALLAGLPQSPSGYNPLIYPERAKKRQFYVLTRMLAAGNITQQQFDESSTEKLNYKKSRVSIEAPHFVQYILADLEKSYGEDAVYKKGLNVVTTIDLDLQKKAESIISYQLEKLSQKNVTNSALLSVEKQTGQILAWVGSADFFDEEIAGQVDLITSLRQPGSALKPFLYLLALENGYTLADLIADLPLKIKTDNGVYSPLNYDLDFHGPVRLREALANSFNIPAVKLQQILGTSTFLSFLKKLGMTSLDQEPEYYGLALTLGGGEVRLIDLANAYLTLSNGGNRLAFSPILQINDHSGEIIYEWKKPFANNLLGLNGRSNAFLITDVLSDPNARLKSFGEGNVLELSFPAAVKTGTTRNFRDNWTVGFSSEILTAVWVGNSDATAMENISGIDGAGPIWHDFMEYYHRSIQSRAFPKPPNIVSSMICSVSGQLPGDKCQEVVSEYFVKGTEPITTDHFWQNFSCNNQIKSLIYYPDEYASWADERGFNPPGHCSQITFSEATKEGQQNNLTILSPLNGDVFQIDNNLPLDSQKIAIKIKTAPFAASTRLSILLDGQNILEKQLESSNSVNDHIHFWLPTRGSHKLIVDLKLLNGQELAKSELNFEVQ